MLPALAFVPCRDVLRRFGEIVKLLPQELIPLAQYFETNYVGTAVTEPLFPVQFWNVYTRVLDGVPRTSNFVEGFHNKWNGALGLRRPPMWRFMLLMCKFQQNTENSLNKIEAGGPPRLQRRLQRLRNHRLVETCSLYSSRFKTVKFRNWITRITLHVPDFN